MADRMLYIYIYIRNIPIGSMYGIYANIWGILMVNGKPYIYIYIPYMDPMGMDGYRFGSLGFEVELTTVENRCFYVCD